MKEVGRLDTFVVHGLNIRGANQSRRARELFAFRFRADILRQPVRYNHFDYSLCASDSGTIPTPQRW